jgi:hypothetical protein
LETPQETSVTFDSSKRLRARLLDLGYVPHDHHGLHDVGSIRVVGTAHHRPQGGAVGVREVPTEYLASSSSRRPIALSVRK